MQCHFKSFSVISLIIAAAVVFFSSCSQNAPELYNTDYSIIFDYTDDQTPPSARLSVFASSGSDVRRYQKIIITSVETGYCWETEVLNKLEVDDLQWAGCTNIAAPENEKLPVGKYEITYYNADEKECSVTVNVKYDTELYEVLLPALQEFMEKNYGIEKIAVYDKEHIMIYFGDRTESFRTTRDIWNTYREAAYYQVIWYSRNGTVICIAPEKPVSPEVVETSEIDEENDAGEILEKEKMSEELYEYEE